MKKLWALRQKWQPFMTTVMVLVAAIFALTYRLRGLVPGLSAPEVANLESARTLAQLIENPIFLPYKLPVLLLNYFNQTSIFALRGISVAFALMCVALLFVLLNHWYPRRLAVIGVLLFSTSSWFLHSARLASPYILYVFGPLMLLTAGFLLYFSSHKRITLIIASSAAAAALYIPGLIWLVVAAIIGKHRFLFKRLKESPWWLVSLSVVLALLIASPLAYASAKNLGVARDVAGLPKEFLNPLVIGKIFISIPSYLIARGIANPILNLGALPLLDIFTVAMVTIGIYAFWEKPKRKHIWILLGMTLISMALIAVNDGASLAMMLPLVYIVATGGILYLLKEWFSIFPRNPLARALGLGIVLLSVSGVSAYHLQRYFVAWSQSPATRASFNKELPQ